MRILIGGIIGALVGSCAWIALEYQTQTEYGWFAWIVGLITGLAVHWAAGREAGLAYARGAFAALLALVAIVGSRFGYAELMRSQSADQSAVAIVASDTESDDDSESDADDSATVVVEEEVIDESMDPHLNTGGDMRNMRKEEFNPTDMIWICLGGITAYLVGRGREIAPADEEEADESQEGGDEQPSEDEAT